MHKQKAKLHLEQLHILFLKRDMISGLKNVFSAVTSIGATPAILRLSLDRNDVCPGNQVQGIAYLNVLKDEIDCTALAVTVFGFEYSEVHFTEKSHTGIFLCVLYVCCNCIHYYIYVSCILLC